VVQLVPVQFVRQKVPFQVPVQFAGLVQFVPVQLVEFALQKVPFQVPVQFAGLLVQFVPVQLVVQLAVPFVVLVQAVVQLQVVVLVV
jgi:hypothetical protein